ncbi:MAG: hypothetical protein AB8E74_05265 [Prochlorococcus sp.]
MKTIQSLLLAAASTLPLTAILLQAEPLQAKPKLQVFDNRITLAEVEQAQKGWCKALIGISNAYQKGGYAAAKAKAGQVIDAAYGYGQGPVAFKPTYAVGANTFRTDRAGAVAYFVGPDSTVAAFGKDQGFATYRHWVSCKIDDSVVQLFGSTANTMGFLNVKDANGGTGRVEKTFTFWKPKDGSNIRIVLHHSSAPFDAR